MKFVCYFADKFQNLDVANGNHQMLNVLYILLNIDYIDDEVKTGR